MSKANSLLIVLFIHFKIHSVLFNPMPNQYINFDIHTMFHICILTQLFYQFTLTIYDIWGLLKISWNIGALHLMYICIITYIVIVFIVLSTNMNCFYYIKNRIVLKRVHVNLCEFTMVLGFKVQPHLKSKEQHGVISCNNLYATCITLNVIYMAIRRQM